MAKFIDRTHEESVNKFGSKIIIVEYRNCHDLDVLFPEYNYRLNHVTYGEIKRQSLVCPYEKRIYNKGYFGVGEFKSCDNSKTTDEYVDWYDMLKRVYDIKYLTKHTSYIGTELYEDWHNFQLFAQWRKENYYEIPNQKMCLDKDILTKGNKLYSPDTCIYVPQNINKLFTKSDKIRGEYPIGVYLFTKNMKYKAQCNNGRGKTIHLGYFDTPEEAFNQYKKYKEHIIKEVADEYKEYIPHQLYQAMYDYRVEITD